MIWVDLKELNLWPVLESPIRNIVPNLVYAASGHEVTHAMVAGRMVLRDRRVLNADEDAIRDEAQRRADEVGAASPWTRTAGTWRCCGRWRPGSSERTLFP